MKTITHISNLNNAWVADLKELSWVSRVIVAIPMLVVALLLFLFSAILIMVKLIDLFGRWLFSKVLKKKKDEEQ